MNYIHLTLAFSLVIFANSAYALRCGTKLVDEGSSSFEVLKLCGEPISKQTRSVYRTKRIAVSHGRPIQHNSTISKAQQFEEITEEIQIEEWVYNFGPNRFSQQISFENGIVINIESLGYGF